MCFFFLICIQGPWCLCLLLMPMKNNLQTQENIQVLSSRFWVSSHQPEQYNSNPILWIRANIGPMTGDARWKIPVRATNTMLCQSRSGLLNSRVNLQDCPLRSISSELLNISVWWAFLLDSAEIRKKWIKSRKGNKRKLHIYILRLKNVHLV